MIVAPFIWYICVCVGVVVESKNQKKKRRRGECNMLSKAHHASPVPTQRHFGDLNRVNRVKHWFFWTRIDIEWAVEFQPNFLIELSSHLSGRLNDIEHVERLGNQYRVTYTSRYHWHPKSCSVLVNHRTEPEIIMTWWMWLTFTISAVTSPCS